MPQPRKHEDDNERKRAYHERQTRDAQEAASELAATLKEAQTALEAAHQVAIREASHVDTGLNTMRQMVETMEADRRKAMLDSLQHVRASVHALTTAEEFKQTLSRHTTTAAASLSGAMDKVRVNANLASTMKDLRQGLDVNSILKDQMGRIKSLAASQVMASQSEAIRLQDQRVQECVGAQVLNTIADSLAALRAERERAVQMAQEARRSMARDLTSEMARSGLAHQQALQDAARAAAMAHLLDRAMLAATFTQPAVAPPVGQIDMHDDRADRLAMLAEAIHEGAKRRAKEGDPHAQTWVGADAEQTLERIAAYLDDGQLAHTDLSDDQL